MPALTYAFLSDDFSVLYVAQNSNIAAAADLQIRRLGRARGLAAAVGADARPVDRRGGGVQPQPRAMRARVLAVLGLSASVSCCSSF